MNSMAEYLLKIEQLIEAHGWAVQGVMTNPPFFYTVGLAKQGIPEIVVAGLDFDTARVILNTLAHKVLSRDLVLEEGREFTEVFEGFSARFKRLSLAQTQGHLRVSEVMFPDSGLPAWQLLWPDPSGRFEGEPGFNADFSGRQNLDLIAGAEEKPGH